ncbi:MAG TPA: hypothetical protein VK255_02525 [Patescibacteria group bacterium]|nr:hypothetical protein [Patescibacteria group bacterium]
MACSSGCVLFFTAPYVAGFASIHVWPRVIRTLSVNIHIAIITFK